MDTYAVQAMLQEDRAEWEALCAVLDGQAQGPLHDPESPEWTSRDVYTHLARLMESTTTLLAKLADVPVPGADPFDEFQGNHEDVVNARIQSRYGHLTFDEACDWAQRVFEERIRAIEAVPPDRWDAQIEGFARADGAGHYRGHRSYIAVA